jgi:hypothetical protein
MDTALALEILKKHSKALIMEQLDVVLIPALEEATKKSATPIDDLALAALKEPFKKALADLLAKI